MAKFGLGDAAGLAFREVTIERHARIGVHQVAVEDLVKSGILDPTKVVRTAIQNAASVASLLLTTEAAVAEKPEKRTPAPSMGDMSGMDDF